MAGRFPARVQSACRRSEPSQSRLTALPDSPFCRCATSSPGAGEVFPLRGSFISADLQIAKSSPFGGAGERSEPERVCFPPRRASVGSGAATAVFRHDPTCEKGVLKSPQAFQDPKIINFIPLNMPRATRRAFPIVPPYSSRFVIPASTSRCTG